jgi:hypothetical protein
MGIQTAIGLLVVGIVYVCIYPKECMRSVEVFPADLQSLFSKPWSSKTLLEKSYLAALVMTGLAIVQMPYAYYYFFRVGMCVCLYFYFVEARKQVQLDPAWFYVFAGLALLYNPIIPIHLGQREIWTFINAATILVLYRARLVIDPTTNEGGTNTGGDIFKAVAPIAGAVRTAARGDENTDWVHSFILYYVASEMRFHAEEDLPHTVRALAAGQTTIQSQQSLLSKLQSYLSFACGRNRQPDDLFKAVGEGRKFVRAELQALNAPTALRRFIARMHKEDTGKDISAEELETQYENSLAVIRVDPSLALRMRNALLRDSVYEQFAARHGLSFDDFISREIVVGGQ